MVPILTIIINWNGLELTHRCIQSLIAQKGCKSDILVVDNCSDVNPETLLKKEFPTIQLIRNNTNLGVAGGRNIGIRYALKHGYHFLLLFDNDAFADEQMVSYLLTAASQNPSAGILGPKIFRDDKENVIWRAGCTSWKLTYLQSSFKILRPIFRFIGKYSPLNIDPVRGVDQKDIGQFDEEREIAFQIGCAQFIRAEVFKDVDLLDEEFTPYGSEDIDFCARVLRANWQIWYIPRAKCWHRIGGSFQDEYQRAYYNAKHLLLLARKNLSFTYFWLCFFPDFTLLTVPLMLLQSFVKRWPRRRKAFIDALIWNFKDIFKRGIFIRKSFD